MHILILIVMWYIFLGHLIISLPLPMVIWTWLNWRLVHQFFGPTNWFNPFLVLFNEMFGSFLNTMHTTAILNLGFTHEQLKKEGRKNEYERHKLEALNQRQKMVSWKSDILLFTVSASCFIFLDISWLLKSTAI